ncbi:MAG: hypothetical protein WAU25_10220, partial [Nitrososphaeraceae archaeon]
LLVLCYVFLSHVPQFLNFWRGNRSQLGAGVNRCSPEVFAINTPFGDDKVDEYPHSSHLYSL